MLALAIKNAQMRTEEFVRGADQEIAIESAHVDGSVRRVVDGVDVAQRAARCARRTTSATSLMVPTALEA